MLQNIFLDDLRCPQKDFELYLSKLQDGFGKLYQSENWTIVRTDEDYKKLIKIYAEDYQMIPEKISFDNDIQCGDIEGYHLLKWTLEYYDKNFDIKLFLRGCEIKFHTANIIGRDRMVGIYDNYLKYYLY